MTSDRPPPLNPAPNSAARADGGAAVPGPIAETLNEPLGASTGRAAPEVFEHGSGVSLRGAVGEEAAVGKDGKEGPPIAAHGPAEAEPVLEEMHANGLTDQTNYLPVKQVLVCFASLQLCVVLAFLDQTIVSPASSAEPVPEPRLDRPPPPRRSRPHSPPSRPPSTPAARARGSRARTSSRAPRSSRSGAA